MTNEDWKNSIDDPAAYEKLYTGSFRRLFNYGSNFTSNHVTIEDAIQETFLQLWINRTRVANVTSFNAYSIATFRNTLLRNIRKESKVVSIDRVEEEPHFSIELDFINREVDHELQLKMKSALDALTAHQREAIFLRFYQNLSYDEVAEVLNITVKATYKIMARSLAALRENLPPLILLALFTGIPRFNF